MTLQRKLAWTGVALVSTVGIFFIAAYLTFRTEGFHRYLLTEIQTRASAAMGARVEVQDFDLRLSALTADAYGITVHGSGPGTSGPFAHADRLRVRLKIASFLHRKIDFDEIEVLHPIVNFVLNKNGGTNLPKPPESKDNSSTNPFDLGIQHVFLDHGEIYYNDVKTPVNAELHDLHLEIRSALTQDNYRGTLSYRDGRVQYGKTKPLPHNLTAEFQANPSEFTLKPLVLEVASSTLWFEGQLQNYSQPLVRGSYKITVHPRDIRPVVQSVAAAQSDNVPAGEVTVLGSLAYQHRDNGPALRALVIDGRLNGSELAINSRNLQTVFRNVHGAFHLADGNLDVHKLEVDLLGGHLSASANVRHLDAANSAGAVRAAMESISLDDANAAGTNARFTDFPVHGALTGTAEASWTSGVKTMKARSDVRLKAVLRSGSAGYKDIPLGGEFHVAYDGASDSATVNQTYLSTTQIRINLSGTAGQNLDLQLQAHAADLREIDSLVAAFQNFGTVGKASFPPQKSVNLAGTADFQLSAVGPRTDPRIVAQLTGHNLQLENTEWRSLAFGLHASKSSVSVQNGSLVNAQQGYINFAASSGLFDWHYLPSSPLSLEVKSQGLAINSLLQLARLNYPVSGNLAMNLMMRGSQLNPQGNGSIHLTQAKAYGQPLQEVVMQFTGDGNTVTSSLDLNTPAGAAKAKLTYHPKYKGYELQCDAPEIRLADVQPLQQKNAGIAGILAVSASGRGTLDEPQITTTLQIRQLQIHQTRLSGISSTLNVADHKANLTLDSEVAQTRLQARGTVDLTGEHYLRANFDTKGVPIEGLLALYSAAKSNGPHGVVEVHASAEGPLDDKEQIKAQLVIPTLKAEYQGLQISNTEPVRIHYANAIVAMDPTEFTGTDTDFRLQGQLPLHSDAPTTLAANGSIDLRLLQFFQHDLQSSGKLQLDLRGTGTTAHPSVQGQIRLQNVSVIPADAPVSLQNVHGVLSISNDQINITQLDGEAGGGQITAHGVIGYPAPLQMNVGLQAKNVRIRYQDQIRSVLEGNLNLVGTTQAATLNGRMLIDSLSFTPNFDLASFAGQVQSGPESAPIGGMAHNLKLDIAVQTARDMNLSSSAVSLEGQANLRVIGTAADPVIVGRTEFTAGDIFLLNQRYRIERGTIEFPNPNRTEPVLNVLLTSTINQYNLSLTFRGPLDKLQTNYVSDPPLATADIINLITRGQTTEQAAASPSNLGATSLLAQGAASQVSGGLQKLAGLSSLSIDPTLGGNNSDPSARIAMQKRVTNNFLFTFATDVTSAQREIIQGEYKINKGWSASVTRDENGGFAVDGKYHKRY